MKSPNDDTRSLPANHNKVSSIYEAHKDIKVFDPSPVHMHPLETDPSPSIWTS